MGSAVISAVGQADDVILMSNDIYSLQLLVKLTEDYCQKYRVKLEPKKTKLLGYYTKKSELKVKLAKKCNPITINNTPVQFTTQAEHVGVWRNSAGNMPNIMYSVKGRCDVENCPHRHPQICRSWKSTNYCEININCDFLHVTMANGDDGYQISTPKFKCASCKNVWEERSCIVTHIIQGHETFFCLNCEDWVKFKTNVFDQNWTLYDEAGNLKRDI